MPRAKKVDTLNTASTTAEVLAAVAADVVTLKYSDEDMQKLDQFAIGLLGDTSTAAGCILEGRIRAAYLRAEVMLTIRKEIAALEIQ